MISLQTTEFYMCGHIWYCVFFAALTVMHTTNGAQFTFIPSSNITILQSAVYKCILDGHGPNDPIAVQWLVNNTSWSSLTSTYNIVADGTDTSNSTLTIPGDPALNKTTVKSVALATINGKIFINESTNTLYLQGKPSGVDLYCILFSLYTIKCNWSIPYTLPGVDITGYNVNVTSKASNDLIMNTTVNEFQYTYSVSKFGVYKISVAAVIDDLEGEIDHKFIESPKVEITQFFFNVINKTKYSIDVHVNISKNFQDQNRPKKIVLITESPSEINEHYTTNVTVSEDYVSGIVHMNTIVTRQRINALVALEYGNMLRIYSNQTKELSTFHVQKVHINDSSNTTGVVCFECEYAPFVTNPTGCFIDYICTVSEGNVTIRSSTEENQKPCVRNIPISHYNMSAYDVENNEPVSDHGPAYTVLSTLIGGYQVMPSSKEQKHMHSSNFMPTTTNEMSTKKSTETNKEKTDIIIISLVTGISIIALMIVIIMLVLFLMVKVILIRAKGMKNNTEHKSSPEPLELEATTAKLNYIVPDIKKRGPNPSLGNVNNTTFPYIKVQPSKQEDEAEYSKLHRESQNQKPTAPCEKYSTLNEISSQQSDTNNCATVQVSESKELTYKFLVENIIPEIPHKWKEFGEQLAIIPPKLEEIHDNHPHNNRNKFCDIIQEWQTSETTKSFSWKTLNEVLRSIKEDGLLESKVYF